MTSLNTIIEEEVEAYKSDYAQAITDVGGFGLAKHIERFLATAMQRAYKAGANNERASWLRSEIEKVEGDKQPNQSVSEYYSGYNKALTSIITRYKEELLELEKGV